MIWYGAVGNNDIPKYWPATCKSEDILLENEDSLKPIVIINLRICKRLAQ